MSREKLTPTTLSANLSYVAGMTPEDLQKQTVHELRALLKGCGVTQVTAIQERTSKGIVIIPGQEIRRADATRDECLKAIAEITIDKKLLAVATEFNETVIVEELPRRGWLKAALMGYDLLGLEIARKLNTYILEDYPEAHQFGTRSVVRSKYCGKVKATLKAEGTWEELRIKDRYNSFYGEMIELGKEDNQIKNRIIGERKLERKERNRTTTDYTTYNIKPLIAWAEARLNTLPISSREWREVALALALVTGRRVTSEILISSSVVDPLDSGSINFTGTAKEREGTNKGTINIPTLVESSLVQAGMQWLKDKGKTEEDRDKAHSRFSSDLTKKWREIAERFELPVFDQLPEKEQKELHKTHGCRKLYTNTVLMREGLTEGTAHPDIINARVQAILGHEQDGTSAFYRMPLVITEE
jgi:hypothetical protein